MTQGTEDEKQGTGDIGWETKYKDVREGTKDIIQGLEKGKEEWVRGGKTQKMHVVRQNDCRAGSANK